MQNSFAVYVHIPFCAKKCAYCDFNAYSGLATLHVDFVDALRQEIRQSPRSGDHVSTIYFGGGTPTQLSGSQLKAILDEIRSTFNVESYAEITSESNPTFADAEQFTAMRSAGFNRLSVGIQSFDNALLQKLDREHSSSDAERAIGIARQAGFTNISIDLMFGLPDQTVELWTSSLDKAVDLNVQHISAYGLTLEPGTRFERLYAGGNLSVPDEDAQADMFEFAIDRLSNAGYEQYEVSNFAQSGRQSEHNKVYWRNGDYAGFGPGAVSYLSNCRSTNEKFPARYISKVRQGDALTVESEVVDWHTQLAETIFLGLRLLNGLEVKVVNQRFETDIVELYKDALNELQNQRLITFDKDKIKITKRGLLLMNEVAERFLP